MIERDKFLEHHHDGSRPICPCGYMWEWALESDSGSRTYTDDHAKRRYEALYGKPPAGHRWVRL